MRVLPLDIVRSPSVGDERDSGAVTPDRTLADTRDVTRRPGNLGGVPCDRDSRDLPAPLPPDLLHRLACLPDVSAQRLVVEVLARHHDALGAKIDAYSPHSWERCERVCAGRLAVAAGHGRNGIGEGRYPSYLWRNRGGPSGGARAVPSLPLRQSLLVSSRVSLTGPHSSVHSS